MTRHDTQGLPRPDPRPGLNSQHPSHLSSAVVLGYLIANESDLRHYDCSSISLTNRKANWPWPRTWWPRPRTYPQGQGPRPRTTTLYVSDCQI